MSGLVKGFQPFYTESSKVLILGSFPSVKSREQSFYYGHPQNAFWRIISNFFGEKIPRSVEEKKAILSNHDIALWDIVTECEIVGSQDATIKNYSVADICGLLQKAPIEYILINGKRAYSIFLKYCKDVKTETVCLPSTSPANATRKDESWYNALRAVFK